MRREVRTALGVLLAIGLTLVATVAPAAARTTGKESFRGVIVASGESGTRTVVTPLVVARGVFTGDGRVVEVANRPGDPDTVSRDDLVFPRGTMHLVTTNKSFTPSVNPQTCANTVRIRQTQRIRGGTGAFRHAAGRFAGTLRGRGVAARNPDGTCSPQMAQLVEVAVFSMRGTLSVRASTPSHRGEGPASGEQNGGCRRPTGLRQPRCGSEGLVRRTRPAAAWARESARPVPSSRVSRGR
jgi:hypothetical protein